LIRRAPCQTRSRRTVDRIVDAARAILSEEGAAAFNTNRIAGVAGISVGSVYEYFPDKDAIIDRVSDDIAEKEIEAVLSLLRARAGDSPAKVVEAVVGLLLDLYREHLSLYQGLRTIRAVRESVGTRPAERLVMEEIRKLLAPHARKLGIRDLDLASFTLFHLVESLAFQMIEHGEDRWGKKMCRAEIVRAAVQYAGLDRV
jgi:AcrR family transcriptional regulator